MPTALPRIQITQTEPVAAALKVAAGEWPDASRAEQIARLLSEGARAVSSVKEKERLERRRALEASRAAVSYPSGYLERLRDEWPE